MWLFFEKAAIGLASAFINGFNIFSHICGFDNIWSKFDFQGPGLRVHVDMMEIFSNLSQP